MDVYFDIRVFILTCAFIRADHIGRDIFFNVKYSMDRYANVLNGVATQPRLEALDRRGSRPNLDNLRASTNDKTRIRLAHQSDLRSDVVVLG